MDKLSTESGENPINEFESVHEHTEIKQNSSDLETFVSEKDPGADGAENFLEMYEESLKTMQEGELVRGEIVQIEKKDRQIEVVTSGPVDFPFNGFVKELSVV